MLQICDGAVKPNGFLLDVSASYLDENTSLAELITGSRATIPALFVGEISVEAIEQLTINILIWGHSIQAKVGEGAELVENITVAWADWVNAACGLKCSFRASYALNFWTTVIARLTTRRLS